jgi:ferric-dicitrate binding protein FerR (iron transport regulator)
VEELEVPIESSQEKIQEEAREAREKWISHVALTAAILAVLAAITALLAGHHSNEAMIEQIKSSDQWSFYQAKGIKSAILNSKMELLDSLGKVVSEKDRAKASDYSTQQEEIKTEAAEHKEASEKHLESHNTLAKGVTLFQVAIAVSAISVLMRRRRFWALSLLFGFAGLIFLFLGLKV